MNTKIAIHGAAGRMGRRLCALAHEGEAMTLVEAVDRANHPEMGQPFEGNVGLSAALSDVGDVVVDFSAAASTVPVIDHCVAHHMGLVIGTTGLGDSHQQAIDAAAKTIPVIQATNYSLVVNVMHDLIARAAKLFGPDYDLEILEAHHRYKKDAPSGTALSLARTLCEATDRSFEDNVKLTRAGDDAPRLPDDITVQTLRIGDHAGEHTVYFAAPGERLEIKHVSTSRDSYAIGALRAACWLHGKKPGRYTMRDVLGL